MVRTVILARHGDAEDVGPGGDIDRSLTANGLEALRAAYPQAFGSVRGSGGSLALWSSPAKRALQTASVVADAIGVDEGDIDVHDCLYEQDQDGFLGELSEACEDVVVAVGHVPFMRHVVRDMTGQVVPFPKGAVVAVAMAAEGDAPGRGRILWHAEP